jgi:formylglycine-generating enzyme required for sulfatase activity
MDATEVTNAQFREFVEATGYVTTAERAPKLEEIMRQVPPGTPEPAKELLVAASMVFTPPEKPVPLHRYDLWWHWMPGADWRHPEGPESTIEGRDHHPLIHVSWDDAVAYTEWAGKRLPTEAEWECAARGGMAAKPYVWGDAPVSDEHPQANIWQGEFPYHSQTRDGYVRTAPVATFEPNGYGLYDMAGNVWEWCSDWYRPDPYRLRASNGLVTNPTGPKRSFDPREPQSPKRLLRGGSFLCHASYCSAYRPSARRGQSIDTGMSHIGFRCVMTQETWKTKQSQADKDTP